MKWICLLPFKMEFCRAHSTITQQKCHTAQAHTCVWRMAIEECFKTIEIVNKNQQEISCVTQKSSEYNLSGSCAIYQNLNYYCIWRARALSFALSPPSPEITFAKSPFQFNQIEKKHIKIEFGCDTGYILLPFHFVRIDLQDTTRRAWREWASKRVVLNFYWHIEW